MNLASLSVALRTTLVFFRIACIANMLHMAAQRVLADLPAILVSMYREVDTIALPCRLHLVRYAFVRNSESGY